MARKAIATVEDRVKESEDKIRATTRTYQNEIEQMKKKEVANRNYRESVSNHYWNI